MKKFKIFTLLLSLIGCNAFADNSIRLVTTTSTDNSGLTQYLLARFTEQTQIQVHTVAVGTGKALAIARAGDADVILVHSKVDELEFVEQGYGVARVDVMYNDFIVVGPKEIAQADTIESLFAAIFAQQNLFLSRGDDSGTHKKELALWRQAGIQPQGGWYRESGQGMGKTLQIANELGAYTISDRGTWLAQNSQQPSDLNIVFENDRQLNNPYSIIAVNPEKHPHVNYDSAEQFIDWITSEQGQRLISEFRVNGEQLFFPSAG